MSIQRLGVALSLLVLFAGCASTIKDVPVTHIVMFSGSGNLDDPTGNTACAPAPALCNGKHARLKNYKQLSRDAAAQYRRDLLADAAAHAPVVDG